MTNIVAVSMSISLGLAAMFFWYRWKIAARAEYIRTYIFPKGLFDKLKEAHPHLTLKDCQLVSQALRQFFLAHLMSGRGFVAMPSQVTDDLWHELILHTRTYANFCNRAFGKFMHHTPAVELGSVRASNTGLRRCWWHTCRQENIDPRRPTRLPLLFAIDTKLAIRNGFVYVPDCSGVRDRDGNVHCGSDFASSSADGSTDGFGDSGDSGDSGGDGGGCGGGGD